jgi:hypothetical protein
MKLLQQLIMESAPSWQKLSANEAAEVEVFGGRIGTLKATYAEIVSVLGEPTYVHRGRSEQTKATWVLKGSNGAFASIYDYKTNAHYNGEMDSPMDMRQMIDDPEMQSKIKDRMKKRKAELMKDPAYKLGLHNVTEWSISGGFDDVMNVHARKSPTSAAMDLVHAAFGDKVFGTAYGLEFERTIKGKEPAPYVPSHLRNKQ